MENMKVLICLRRGKQHTIYQHFGSLLVNYVEDNKTWNVYELEYPNAIFHITRSVVIDYDIVCFVRYSYISYEIELVIR